jgi:hypothetical protein
MANMMNMASQQRAAQLQGERIRQEMEYARAGENRAEETQRLNVRKEDQAYRVAGMTELRNRGVGVLQSGSEEAYQLWLRQADAIDPDSAAVMRQIAPTFNKDAMTFAITKADEFIANNTSKRKTEIIYDKNGIPILVESGGNTDYEATPIVATKIRDVNQPPRATPTAPPVTAGADVDMRATRGANTTPQDLINQGMNPNNIPSGMPTSRPVSFNQSDMGGAGAVQMTPEVAQQIVDTAVKTGMMAQADFDQLMAMAPEQNKQPFMEMIQANNIKLQPSGMGQRPQSQFADLRSPAPQSQTAGLRGAPPMEQTLAQYRVGDPIQGRNPSVGAYPGSAQVPLGRLGAEKTTEAQAAADVNLRMAPEIAKATKLAERAVEKRSEALVAKNETKAAIQSLDKYIEEIDALLRSPDRRFIVGRIEGNLHYLGSLGQNERQAELQAMYDRIKNADTLGSLVEAKQATPTGGSPVGNASNLDVQLIAKSANSLTQTGGVPKFDEDLKKLRREAYRTRQRRIEFYNDRYGDLSAEDPKFKLTVRPIADRYISSKDLPKPPARSKTPTSRLSAETRAKYGL